MIRELEQLKAYVAEQGSDLTALGVSLHSWWLSQDVSAKLSALGFDQQVIAAKRSTVLEDKEGRVSLGARKKQAVLQDGWGQPREAQ